MSKFLSYLRNDKGGAVEYVLVTAGIGGIIYAAATSTTVKNSVNNMFSAVFANAASKSTF